MNFSRPFIQRPVMTTLLTLAIILFGIAGYKALPVSNLPNVEFPTIQVSAALPGASPATMAAAVATPLERQFSTIQGVTSMTSVSALGSTQITLQFDLERSVDAAALDVQSMISKAGGDLPPDLPAPPSFQKVNPADAPILYLALRSQTLPLSEVDEYAETNIGQRISTVSGVAQVQVYGAQKYAVRVQLDPQELASRQIGVDEVSTAIQNGNVNLPTGVLQGESQALVIQATGQLMRAPAYRPLIVAYRDGAPVRLEQLGRVLDSVENDKVASFIDGEKGIVIAIQKQPGSNTVAVVDAINTLLPKLRTEVPAAVDVQTLYDRSITIRESVFDVQITLVLTIGLVVLVIALFLRNLSATFVSGVALPISIVGTFLVMWLLGYSLDNLSLMALTLSVGFVVDDAIVVLENIFRHLEMGKKPVEAALDGAKEIGFTVISMTISLVAVFIPVLFMAGILGRILREFAVTISVALLMSGVVSLTLTPMLAARFLRPSKKDQEKAKAEKAKAGEESTAQREGDGDGAQKEGADATHADADADVAYAAHAHAHAHVARAKVAPFPAAAEAGGEEASWAQRTVQALREHPSEPSREGKREEVPAGAERRQHEAKRGEGAPASEGHATSTGIFGRVERFYERTLKVVLRHRLATVMVSLAMLGGTVALVMVLPKGLFPSEDTGQIFGQTLAAQGTSFASMKAHQEEAAKIAREHPAVGSVLSSVGAGGPNAGSNAGRLIVRLKPSSERDQTPEEVINDLRPKLAKIPGLQVFMQNLPTIRVGGRLTRGEYQFTLTSTDTDALYKSAVDLEKKIRQIPGLADVSSDLENKNPEVNLIIDRDKAGALGVTARQIEEALFTSFSQRQVSTIFAPTNQFRVIMEVLPEAQRDTSAFSKLYIRSAATGELVPLSTVTRTTEGTGPVSVNHMGQLPAVTISFNLAAGTSLSDATTRVEAAAREGLPPTVSTSFQGTAQVFQESLGSLGWLVVLAVGIIYVVLGVLYESFVHPLTILSGLPSAGFGAFLALWITGLDLDLYAFVGVLMLIGIVKKNAIMMIDFALDAERAGGESPEEAIFEGCVVRFRPIMMTTVAALMGMLPIALGFGAGAEARRPLGVAVVGGLLVSQLITLYLTPVIYVYLDEFQAWVGRHLKLRRRSEATA
ncbi:efflux RND transporter permease subunit [Chondromyces apiculatus]|uniref:RND multidrug efflux transporter/ Acriflavin resistance protein n=1 Tax=Chondromyces apiculatus DSM 436 TaxID=1192034 RepID=A0A017T636_9BACT|nr:efflux RND transporter permease subunit [Chondromyces apiculatus]EYF04728.1 RND multidrug efflux transporter/ Acriflavin resistance protein [Chondromyces apiculatus DSM 436]